MLRYFWQMSILSNAALHNNRVDCDKQMSNPKFRSFLWTQNYAKIITNNVILNTTFWQTNCAVAYMLLFRLFIKRENFFPKIRYLEKMKENRIKIFEFYADEFPLFITQAFLNFLKIHLVKNTVKSENNNFMHEFNNIIL